MAYKSPIGSGFQLPDISTNSSMNSNTDTTTAAAATNPSGGVLGSIGKTFSSGIPTYSGTNYKDSSGNVIPDPSSNNQNVPYFAPPVHPVVAAAAGGAQAAVNALRPIPNGGVTTSQGGYAGSPSSNPYYTGSTQPSQAVPQNLGYGNTTGNPVQSNYSQVSPSQINPGGQMPGMSGGQFNYAAASNGQPFTGYNVTVPNTTDSNVLGSGLSYTDALNARNQLMQDYLNKSNEAAQYEANNMSQTMKDQFSGDTVDYGTGAASLYKAESAPQLLAMQQQAANSLTALQTQQQQAQNLNPFQNQLSPGNTAYNPITGQAQTSGMAAAPATIAALAQQMASTDQSYGTMMTNADGSVNYGAYYQKAQNFLSGGNTSGGTNQTSQYGGTGNTGNTGLQSYNPQPGTPQFASSLPPAVYPALQTTSTGMTYFDSSKVGETGVGAMQQISKATGVPILNAQDADAVQTTDQAMKNLKLLEANFASLASNGVGGALWQNVTDPISGVLQTSRGSALATYNSNRDGLLQQIRALAGSSPRINAQELNLATNALPTLSELNKDTIQTGEDKINTVMGYLNNALTTLVPGYGGQSGQASGSTLSGQGSSAGGWASLGD